MSDNIEIFTINVKTTNNAETVSIEIHSNYTVGKLKELVAQAIHGENMNIRLISSGKLMVPDTALLNTFNLKLGSFVHAVVSKHTPETSSSSSQSNPIQVPVVQAPITYRGFDRLVNSGLTIDEAAAMRTSFLPQIEEYITTHPPNDGENNTAYRYRMEEEWIALQGPTSEYYINLPRNVNSNSNALNININENASVAERIRLLMTARNSLIAQNGGIISQGTTTNFNTIQNAGTGRDFVWGVLLGFAFGFLMLFCLWDRNISQRQRIGILVGVSLGTMTQLFHEYKYANSVDKTLSKSDASNDYDPNEQVLH
jgi:hypothetical protein